MDANDPRHGTYAGAVAHWFDDHNPCEPCAKAETRYRKRRKMRHLHGDTPNVPAIGTVRRFQALMALGWTGPQIATEVGISLYSLRSVDYHGSTVVRRETAAAMEAAYDRLSMTIPDGPYASRAKGVAARNGWPPPLAWDDIDDPHEIPADRVYTEPKRADILTDLDDRQAGITEACQTLDIKRDTLQKWCGNHNMHDVYARLCAREDGTQPFRGNQHRKAAA